MQLGPVGIWTSALDRQPSVTARAAAGQLETMGFSALWVGESFRREVLANAALLLGATARLVVATGIASLWARDAQAMRAGQLTLAEAYPERFLLGIGVSHVPLTNPRGHTYGRPVSTMRAYLAAMDQAPYDAPLPPQPPQRVIAALGPRMLALAAECADGAHSYFVPVTHTASARAILGPGKLLCPEQAVVLETDPARARATARRHTASYLRLPNYRDNLLRLGFSADDVAGAGSDRLVDAVVAWGTVDQIAGRVREHLQAGADHVAVQVITEDPGTLPVESWRQLARKLIDSAGPAGGTAGGR
ncbi:MAG TPA: TIGR03620 family F420-dependent LLM class oxidoreductase [Candidatus Dormibacteraeota bacterium]|nr:TIGR03620 family F420-dependent LLM class oxidoreductase [Candidatus Dormibacteraeota bacterium]